MATTYEPRTDLADRLLSRNDRGLQVGFGSNLFARLGLANPYEGGDIRDRALTEPRFDYLSSRAYLAELRGLGRRRFHLLDRISSLRRILSSHDRFQRRVATTAVRAAALGMDATTLIDWSTQVDENTEDEAFLDDDEGRASGSTGRTEASLRETSATRALRGEISSATGVLKQLQGLLDAQRSGGDRALTRRIATLQQQTPEASAEGAHRMARELRGVASIARRATGVGRHVETTGERPLAVAQARQSDTSESKGLRRILGESPVIMTLEEPEAAPEAPPLPAPRTHNAPQAAPRAAQTSHAGRVARVATEARSQGAVGRAGPPVASAPTSSASPTVGAPTRTIRSNPRPTQRVARAALAATNVPLTDVRRGLAAQAPVPAVRTASSQADSEATSVSRPVRTGVARVAARNEAGLADMSGRVTGATRYLAEPVLNDMEQPPVDVYTDGVVRRLQDPAEAPVARQGRSLEQAAPEMLSVESAVEVEADSAERSPVANPVRPTTSRPVPTGAAPAVIQPARTSPSVGAVPTRPRALQADRPLPPVARAMQRASVGTEVSTTTAPHAVSSHVAISRTPVAHSNAPRDTTGTPLPTPVVTARGAMRSSVSPQTGPRTAHTSQGITRRSRALPTVRAAARTLSQERWGSRGRMLAPAVSRSVQPTSLQDIAKTESRISARVAGFVPTFATPSLDGAIQDTPEVSAPRASASTTDRLERPVRGASPSVERAPISSSVRAAARADSTPRIAGRELLATPHPVSRLSEGTVSAAPLAREAASSGQLSAAPEVVLVTAAHAESQALHEDQAAPVRGLAARATARGREIVPAARRSVLPSVTPEAQDNELARVVERTERRLQVKPAQEASLTSDTEVAGSPFRRARSNSIAADVDPVVVQSLQHDVPEPAVADTIARINGRASKAAVANAPQRVVAATPLSRPHRTPASDTALSQGHRTPSGRTPISKAHRTPAGQTPVSKTHLTPAGTTLLSETHRTPESHTPTSEAHRTPATGVAGSRSMRTPDTAFELPLHVGSIEGPLARAERRAQATRSTVAGSPVVSSRSFADDISTVAPRTLGALAPESVLADGPVYSGAESEAPKPQPEATRSKARQGVERPRATQRRAPSTVRALDRSRARRDLGSVIPHPVGTPRTARASTRMLDRSPGSVAAPEAVLVHAHETVDLAAAVGDTAATARSVPVSERLQARTTHLTDGGVPSSMLDAAASGRAPSQLQVLQDGMTLAENARLPESVSPVSVAGGIRATGPVPGEDRSRRAQRPTVSQIARAVSSNTSVLRAAERGADPVVSLPGARRAYGATADRATRYEARVTQDANGTVLKTVVVDTLTGEETVARTAPQPRPAAAPVPTFAESSESALERAERRENAVHQVDGMPRASVRGSVPEPIIARPNPAQQPGDSEPHAPLGQTFADLTGTTAAPRDQRPMMRRRTWNRRQMAHELGEFAPAMAEAEYLDAPTASEDAPAWARRAVSGTSVVNPQTRGPRAASDVGAPEGVFAENGETRAWEPNSLMGALSRADAPEDLVKVIVERRTELQVVRETLPTEAVRIVERLQSLSPEEVDVLQGGRALAALPRTSLANPNRGRRGGDFTQLSGANDGVGANNVMKLADKLMGLIHLAESQRMSDAHRHLQMSQDAVEGSSAGHLAEMGKGVDDQTMNMQALKKKVFKELKKELAKIQEQQGDF